MLGLGRHGRTSANTFCHLFRASNGTIALNLAREDDMALMPAWLERPVTTLEGIAAAIGNRDAAHLLDRGREMGLAVACPGTASEVDTDAEPQRIGRRQEPRERTPLVVDLSSLWAGPLAGSLLAMTGAQVIKVESTSRPDAARLGNRMVFDLLNAGKLSVALDFASLSGRNALIDLLVRADIVIEGSRPRALRQLGVHAEELVRAKSGKVWVSITAHGRKGEAASWTGFGDDAAVAGGLATAMEAGWGELLFAGDAIADPLVGLAAAQAAWASWLRGGSELLSLSLSGTIASALRRDDAINHQRTVNWQRLAEADTAPLYPLRTAPPAPPMGADNHQVLAAAC